MEVPVVRLDDLLSGRIPDLIKIDVEGHELEVLRGLRATLDRKATRLAIEVHVDELRHSGASAHELFEILGPRHYDFWFGTGDEAQEGIRPFIPGKDDVPGLSRFYLFSVPKHTATRTAFA